MPDKGTPNFHTPPHLVQNRQIPTNTKQNIFFKRIRKSPSEPSYVSLPGFINSESRKLYLWLRTGTSKAVDGTLLHPFSAGYTSRCGKIRDTSESKEGTISEGEPTPVVFVTDWAGQHSIICSTNMV